ncbi:MAG: hypothetical protein Q4G67_14880 [Actinomycetia bacterium]|nr:hypothetical protein [Actinomycetes bacterium]
MGTGIVFIVLVAIWLAYFVQYWSRRREHLATARSVEAFSEAMRVLERRPAARGSAPDRISTAYAVSPARVVARPAPRPQVIAKPRPAPATPGGDSGMRLNVSAPTSASALVGSARATLGRAATSVQGRASGRPGSARTGSGRPGKSGAPVPSRKVRGLTLVASLLVTLVLAGLAAFSVVVWWVPLVGLAVTVGSFFWLRSAVQAEIKARRAARARIRRSRAAGARPSPGAVPAPRSAADDEHEVAAPDTGHELAEDSTVIATAEAGVQSEATVSTTAEAAPAEAEAGRPDGWQPVPVPPPTYTLKAKAERPTPVFAEDDDIPEAPQFDSAPTSDSDAGSDRRAAYGT